ncbi:MAG TPA: hypothetical protein VJ204_13780 [Solirubrobacterales bacterium]|nr:hypothetical protein [Solirubrobacterales bacterium]
MRRRLPLLVFFALAAMAAVALAQVTDQPQARAAAIAASGPFEISNSHEGQAIFAASGIAPGEATTGTVAIEDTGSEPVALTLRRGELLDEPGVGGGLLSSRLRLTVVDVTRPTAPRTVYAGPLDSMPERPAGTLAGGEARTYEFTATLPEGGEPTFQNAVQGASTTVAYSWVASEAAEEESGGDETTPVEEHPALPNSSGDGGQGNGGVHGEGAPLKLTVPKIKGSVRRGRITAWTNCTMPCRLQVRGRLRAMSATTGTRRVAKVRWTSKGTYAAGAHRVRLRIPRSMRAWMRATPGPERLRARLRFTAVGLDGQRDVVRKVVRLRRHR